MIKISQQFILCVFFLQYTLVANSDQSLGKTKQSHSYSVKTQKSSRNHANSFTDVRRSENCIGLCKKRTVKASWYGPGFHGNITDCGQVYNQYGLTAASNTLPCGTKVKLLYKKTGKSVVVKITDTGGFKKYHRDIDISLGAANKIGMTTDGVAQLQASVIYLPSSGAL